MKTTSKILRYQLRNVLRGRAVLGYALFFAAVTLGLVRFGGGIERALPSLASVVLLAVPLVSMLVAAMTVYEGRDFAELVLSHPVGRRPLFLGQWLGVTLPLAGAFALGTGVPLAMSGAVVDVWPAVTLVLAAGILLTGVFTALAFLVAVWVPDPTRGLGAALLLWLVLTVLYDGLVLLAAGAFSQYPLEKAMLVLMLANPVDLARVLVLMALDASALMGYTGAVFQRFFGSGPGLLLSMASLGAWIALPFLLAARRFQRKDL